MPIVRIGASYSHNDHGGEKEKTDWTRISSPHQVRHEEKGSQVRKCVGYVAPCERFSVLWFTNQLPPRPGESKMKSNNGGQG